MNDGVYALSSHHRSGDDEGRTPVPTPIHPNTMTDYPSYDWKYKPDDGEYELQFDRFETSADGDRNDLSIFLIADTDKDLRDEGRLIGDVAYPTADVPGIDGDSPATTRIYDATIQDNTIIEMTYKPEISKQRHEEAQQRYDRLTGKTDAESDG